MLITFSTPFVGGPAFFTGTSASSSLVPWTFPVAFSGRPFALDTAQPFQRAFEQRLRESTDDGTIPGEATINPQGLWRRSQTSWHQGAGQQYADTSVTASTERFWSSKGIDPWTEGELRLLPETSQSLSSANTNLPLTVADNAVFVGDGDTLKYSTDLASWTSITTGAPPGAAITALGSDGSNVYIGYESEGIYIRTPGSSSVSAHYPTSPTETFTVIGYAKGFVFACHDNDIHQPVGGGTHTELYPHPNTSFVWTGICTGQNAIYFSGHADDVSLVYKITIKADGNLDEPVVAGELPTGEIVHSMFSYLGFVVLGTDRGVRFCTTDQEANLVIGPVLETTNPVLSGAGFGRFVWYGWTNYDATSTGLGRMDIGQLVAQNRPAYASDLMVDAQGAVNAVTIFNGQPVFSVSGQGVYKQGTDLVATGTLDTGVWRWQIPDTKFLAFVDLLFQPLQGTVTICRTFDGGNCQDIGTASIGTTTSQTFDGPTDPFREARFEIDLTRSATDATAGPVLTRWQARAVPSPTRSELFVIPVLLHRVVQVENRDYYFDTENDLNFLHQLVSNARIIQLQIGSETYKAIVENVEFTADGTFGYPLQFEGTASVTVRSLVA